MAMSQPVRPRAQAMSRSTPSVNDVAEASSSRILPWG